MIDATKQQVCTGLVYFICAQLFNDSNVVIHPVVIAHASHPVTNNSMETAYHASNESLDGCHLKSVQPFSGGIS